MDSTRAQVHWLIIMFTVKNGHKCGVSPIFRQQYWKTGIPGLVNKQKAMENGPVEIVDLPINSMVDLSIVFC